MLTTLNMIPDSNDSDIKYIFPTTIIQTHITGDDFQSITKEINDSLEKQQSYVPSNFIGNSPYFSNGEETKNDIESGRGINRSPITSNYISDYSIDTLGRCVSEQLKKYLQITYTTLPDYLLSRLVLNSWLADYRDEKTHLLAHQHENSFINAVYYHQVNENQGGELVLYSPSSYMSYINPSHQKIFIKPTQGMLLVFPSWMQHAVNSFASDTNERRIAISITCRFEYQHE